MKPDVRLTDQFLTVLLGVHTFVMAQEKAGDSRSPRWVGAGITGHMDEANRAPAPEATKRIRIPDSFLHALTPTLGIGSTLMITDEPVLESITGVNLAVLSSSPEDLDQARKQ